ncbi:thiolase family protein [Kroppenstedtia eburnea]|uniref:acetyl-CoA C-acyltransferase n=1 Tax=Kroppenstedtia eburnea TaxID=714067 RepID=A0A1N7ME35_9BACL|nr:acetyl-CoA C-acyltransferase [Kroppenstedtia eburnea]QKI81513.1 acetyl-CoA C-acyltransferase [Kroppenstedtia eburnea]SIS84280.1 acetyl-CoA C-acetyltransferase [Kroppenstedtia eburnea]
MGEAVIIDALRTPIGRYRGGLSGVRPDDLAAHAIRALLERNPGVDPGAVEDVIFGCANQAGEDNRNVARMALLLAGLPRQVAGSTVNRLCGSGLEAVNQAVAALKMGAGDIFVAGGVESMSRAPLVMLKPEEPFPRGNRTLVDTTLGWRFVNPEMARIHQPIAMGETAENVAEQYGISREEQDVFALESQRKAAAAWEAGRFREEVIPVTVPRRKREPLRVEKDEHLRPDTTLEKLSGLQPAFREGGTVTPGNASGINDGAAALLIMEGQRAEELGLTPLARVVSFAVSGCDPDTMGLGPIFATRKLLRRTGISIGEIDRVELNEAFAAQALACIRELDLDPARVNVNGGAIALGHPLGASGTRILTTLVHELRRCRGRYGLATMCIGVGQGIATLVERIEV